MGIVSDVKMYDFLIRPIRERDLQEGHEFVKRLLQGSQSVWETIQGKIDSVKDLWSVTECPDAYLKYLKRIVGWTPDLHNITDRLDDATLRRLIAASVPLWKSRTTEEAIVDILSLLVPGRSRVWNWFDLRWVLDETVLSEEHQGRDPWLISIPGAPANSEYWSNVRIVDPGAADRTLLKDALNLMRPAGERYEIIYLNFLDLFNVDDDVGQWDYVRGTGSAAVKNGYLSLSKSTEIESVFANVAGTASWLEYVFSARVRGSQAVSPGSGFGLLFNFDPVLGNGYGIRLDVKANLFRYDRYVSWGSVAADNFDLSTIPITLKPNVWYSLRVQMGETGSLKKFRIYLDGTFLREYFDNTYYGVGGTVGIDHTANVTEDCDEIEVMGLPIDKETVEINY